MELAATERTSICKVAEPKLIDTPLQQMTEPLTKAVFLDGNRFKHVRLDKSRDSQTASSPYQARCKGVLDVVGDSPKEVGRGGERDPRVLESSFGAWYK